MISGLDKYAADLTFKAMKAPVGWLCYHNVISGDLNIPYADKGRRHISIWDNFHNFQQGRDILYFQYYIGEWYPSFSEHNKILILKFSFFSLSQKYSLWGYVDQRKLLSWDKQEIVPNPAGFAPLSNQLSKSTPGNFALYENLIMERIPLVCLSQESVC